MAHVYALFYVHDFTERNKQLASGVNVSVQKKWQEEMEIDSMYVCVCECVVGAGLNYTTSIVLGS